MPPPFGLTSAQRSSSPVSLQELQHDRRERLVDLDHRDVVPGQAGTLRAPSRTPRGLPCSIRYGSTPDEPERDEACPRLEPEPRRPRTRTRQHAGGAVADLARVPGRDLSVRAGTRAPARRASRRTCRAAASRRPRRATPACGFVTSTGTISRSKRPSSIAAIARRCDSSEYASSSSRERPHSSAITSAEIPCGTISQRSMQLVGEIAAVRAHRDARHHLDARRDDDVELTRPDRRGRVEVRLHRRAALAVDRRPADRLRPAGDERNHPADVPALLADLGHAARAGRPRPRPDRASARSTRPFSTCAGELVAADRRQRAVPAARSGCGPRRRCRPQASRYSVEAPLARDALELVLAAILERDARARDEVPDRARDEDLARPCRRRRRGRRCARRCPPTLSAHAARTRRCGARRGCSSPSSRTPSRIAQARADRTGGPVEGGEEAVAGRVDLAAAEAVELAPHERVVLARAARASGGRRARPRAPSSRRCR